VWLVARQRLDNTAAVAGVAAGAAIGAAGTSSCLQMLPGREVLIWMVCVGDGRGGGEGGGEEGGGGERGQATGQVTWGKGTRSGSIGGSSRC
jgi:hypothetical protein